MAAACRAAESGARVTVIDDNAGPGGQIWRGGYKDSWFDRFRAASVDLRPMTRVVACDVRSRRLVLETDDGVGELEFDKLILATGARELFLPFPGWTLPGVAGAGGLQALVKSGLVIARKRVVVAGSGPLLLAAAAYLRSQGARIVAIIEQAPLFRLAEFGISLLTSPSKLRQALGIQLGLAGVPYRPDSWVEAAEGDSQIRQVRVHGGSRPLECDYLAVGYGLVPNTELASLLGCSVSAAGIQVDNDQRTAVDGVYAAGECTGIGGLELSLVEGEIAGLGAANGRLTARRRSGQRFADALARAFALRPELRSLPKPSTLVCRCEDVPYQKLAPYSNWREAKLQTRCGMGACQGRVCGAAGAFLFGWSPSSVRPPLLPARVGTLLGQEERS
jgi:NADPH-dependent 2,4-dienoyl-CoA reductase/sulfur reductase-like enzyme